MLNPMPRPGGDFVGHDEEEEELAALEQLRKDLRQNRPKTKPLSDDELTKLLRAMPTRKSWKALG